MRKSRSALPKSQKAAGCNMTEVRGCLPILEQETYALVQDVSAGAKELRQEAAATENQGEILPAPSVEFDYISRISNKLVIKVDECISTQRYE